MVCYKTILIKGHDCRKTTKRSKVVTVSPPASSLPPWVQSPAVLKKWYEKANELRRANTVDLWCNGGSPQDHDFTLFDMARLRRMDRRFEDFESCTITVDNYMYLCKITMDLKLTVPDADALLEAEHIKRAPSQQQDQSPTCPNQQPVWSSDARYSLEDIGRGHLVPMLTLDQSDVHPYTLLVHAPTTMWGVVRAFVKARAIALYWQENTQRRLCAPDGLGRMLDRLAYEQWNMAEGFWA